MVDRQKTVIDVSKETVWMEQLCERYGRTQEQLIPILQAIQRRYRYLPQPLLKHLSTISSIKPAEIVGVASFFDQFRFTPAGLHMVKICIGTACHVKGAQRVYDALQRALGCTGEEDTGKDGVFTLQKVACLGCCTLAPVVQIDSVTYGQVTASSAHEILDDFLKRKKIENKREAVSKGCERKGTESEVRIGLGSCCMAGGSAAVAQATSEALRKMGNPAILKPVGCVGMCHRTPLLEIKSNNGTTVTYESVSAEDIPQIISTHFKPKTGVRRIVNCFDEFAERVLTGRTAKSVSDAHLLPIAEGPVRRFLDKQKYIATEFRGTLDPTDIDEYCRDEGFVAMKHCLTKKSPIEVIEVIRKSGLRGRGGAGFPTAEKWELVNKNSETQKYVICNGDEGDPGAFMDRMLFESYPYRIIEGMVIGAYAVGASEGIIYLRAEYKLAVKRIREAIDACKASNYLGENIAGTSFCFNLRIMEGAGAFVCGEETALINSIEGKRGMPRFRPPYPAQKGLFGKPTLINNCETFACIPWILRNGASAFSQVGTSAGTGTKVFSLAGKVRYGGLIEVPMGSTIREIVEQIGGGVTEGRHFKAVQIGGPSGGCIPASASDVPVDYKALLDAGAMMGSGGLVVLDDGDCMVDIARYFLHFTQQQSCGRCTFCRVGTRRMLDILEMITEGRGSEKDLKRLEELAHSVKSGSLCGLGQTAPNPVLTTLHYFRDEYIAHCNGLCPAGKCKSLITYYITESCIGCTRCAQLCPTDAITFTPYRQHVIDDKKCIRCDTCRNGCPVDAITTLPIKDGNNRKQLTESVSAEGNH